MAAKPIDDSVLVTTALVLSGIVTPVVAVFAGMLIGVIEAGGSSCGAARSD
jgi:hypothetical protein